MTEKKLLTLKKVEKKEEHYSSSGRIKSLSTYIEGKLRHYEEYFDLVPSAVRVCYWAPPGYDSYVPKDYYLYTIIRLDVSYDEEGNITEYREYFEPSDKQKSTDFPKVIRKRFDTKGKEPYYEVQTWTEKGGEPIVVTEFPGEH